jgi:hypothetical protein
MEIKEILAILKSGRHHHPQGSDDSSQGINLQAILRRDRHVVCLQETNRVVSGQTHVTTGKQEEK